MRIVAMKNRQSEFGAVRDLLDAGLFPDDIVPLVEIISEGGLYDIAKWSELLGDHILFADYLRCDIGRYKRVKMERIELILQLNANMDLYQEKIIQLTKYSNIIPVVSARAGAEKISPTKMRELVLAIKMIPTCKAVAVRIDSIDGYEEVIMGLDSSDYVIYDINEQPHTSKILEYEELFECEISAQTVLLCSPRAREINNGSYERGSFTSLIDASGENEFSGYGFDAYGDYGGLKDDLPHTGSGNKGYALALFYCHNTNQFMSYRHDDFTIGSQGFRAIVPDIVKDKSCLDPDGSCLALEMIEKNNAEGRYGNWNTWSKYTLMRTIQQLGQQEN